jgi:hypothetical protein
MLDERDGTPAALPRRGQHQGERRSLRVGMPDGRAAHPEERAAHRKERVERREEWAERREEWVERREEWVERREERAVPREARAAHREARGGTSLRVGGASLRARTVSLAPRTDARRARGRALGLRGASVVCLYRIAPIVSGTPTKRWPCSKRSEEGARSSKRVTASASGCSRYSDGIPANGEGCPTPKERCPTRRERRLRSRVPLPDAWAAMRRSNDGMLCAKVGMLHPFLAMLQPFLMMHRPLLARHHPFLAMHRPLLPTRRPFVATLRAFLAMHRPLFPMRRPLVAMHPPFLAMHRPLLPMRRPFVARLYAFAATPCEGEGARHEESCGRHAVRHVPFLALTTPQQSRGRAVPSRERGSECVGSSSERGEMRPAYVGMPRETLEMPNEDSAMRSMQGLHLLAHVVCELSHDGRRACRRGTSGDDALMLDSSRARTAAFVRGSSTGTSRRQPKREATARAARSLRSARSNRRPCCMQTNGFR